MKASIKTLNDEENKAVCKLDEKIEAIQSEIDSLLSKYTELQKPINELKDKIREKRKLLSPLSQLKASICSPSSRDKYHPEETKTSILKLAEKI